MKDIMAYGIYYICTMKMKNGIVQKIEKSFDDVVSAVLLEKRQLKKPDILEIEFGQNSFWISHCHESECNGWDRTEIQCGMTGGETGDSLRGGQEVMLCEQV